MIGCSSEVEGYSTYCDTHKRRNRRHGHPDQMPVSTKELEPHREQVRQRIAKNAGNPAWSILQQRWNAICDRAASELVLHQSGVPHSRYVAEAMSAITKLSKTVDPQDVIEVVVAMYLLEDKHPHRFKNHEAFGRQLVRRVRALSDMNVGTYYDQSSGKTKRVYREAKPKTTDLLADILRTTFGAAALAVVTLERKEAEAQRTEQLELHAALTQLI